MIDMLIYLFMFFLVQADRPCKKCFNGLKRAFASNRLIKFVGYFSTAESFFLSIVIETPNYII